MNYRSLRELLMPVVDCWQLLVSPGQRESAPALVAVVIPEFSPRLADWRPAPVEKYGG